MKRIFAALLAGALMAGSLAGCGNENSSTESGENTEKTEVSSTEEDNGKPTVYASFYPIKDMTEKIAGDKVNVVSFMPEDKEAHHWEPSAKDIKEVNDADLMFINGAGMESWIDSVEQNAPNLKIINLSKDLDLIEVGSAAEKGEYGYMGEMELKKEDYKIETGHTHEKALRLGFFKLDGEKDIDKLKEEGKKIMSEDGEIIEQKETFDAESGKVYNLEMAHEDGEIDFKIPEEGNWIVYADREPGESVPYIFSDKDGNEVKLEDLDIVKSEENISYDPHSWMSLENAKLYTDRIANRLSELSPENKEYFEKNKEEYQNEIKALKEEYDGKFENTRIKSFVVPHEAFGYVSREFGLQQHPLQGLTSMEEPDLKTIQESIEYCKENGINTVFYEYGGSKKGAESIAKEIDGKIEPLSTMEFVTEDQKEKNQDYLALMRMNLENIYNSLQ